MRDEVEEFLRRAAQRRAQVEAQARGAGQGKSPPKPPPNRRLAQQAEPLIILQPVEAQVVDAGRGQSVDRIAAEVNQLSREATAIGAHSARLGSEVDRADDALDNHLNSVFNHKVGSLQSTPIVNATGAAASPSLQQVATATQTNILRMLRTPGGMRDAIIISEVLRRPVERWD
jgi:hypothetical protein